MYRLRDLIVVFLCGGVLFGLGVWMGQSNEPVTVHAQVPYPGDRYEIFHNPFGSNSWYALKHDRQTGETWVLSGAYPERNDWMLLPEDDKREK
jgi:hypothetical protein